jgi:hypothetical protein
MASAEELQKCSALGFHLCLRVRPVANIAIEHLCPRSSDLSGQQVSVIPLHLNHIICHRIRLEMELFVFEFEWVIAE